jgi:branched-chain amino acid transport system substrate-binding protein
MNALKPLALAIAALAFATTAQADITIGVSVPLTGPTSALGIPCKNGITLWPTSIGGESSTSSSSTTPPIRPSA